MKEKDNKNVSKWILFSITSVVLGLFLGVFTSKVSFDFIDRYFKGESLGIEIIKLSIIGMVIFLCFILQIIIHEGGHLIFGLLSGYKFVSFRIGSITLIREEDKWKLKKFNLPGTGGQCLLMPPGEDKDKFPFVMYNLGGVLLNLIFGIIPIFIVVIFKQIPLGVRGFLSVLGGVGVLCALLNGIPLKAAGIANDGSNVLSLIRDKEARRAFYMQLWFNGLLSKGRRPGEMDINDFELNEGADIYSPINTAMVLMKYNYYLDRLELQKGRQVLKDLSPYYNKIIGIYRYEIYCERIFLELALGGDRALVEKLYDKELIKYIKACKGMISKKRVMMCYELLYNKDKEKAMKLYEEGKALAKTYPIKGEIEMEFMLMDYIWNMELADINYLTTN